MKKYDYLIVGAGLFGAVFAHEKTNIGKSCLVISKKGIKMKRPDPVKLIVNTFRGDPK